MRQLILVTSTFLAACGGGGSTGVSPVTIVSPASSSIPSDTVVATPAPAPTPTPAPSPTPTALSDSLGTVGPSEKVTPAPSLSRATTLTFHRHSAKNAWNVFANADGSNRFEVRQGDVAAGDPTDKERAELASDEKLSFGKDYQLNFKFQVDASSRNDAEWMTITQVQSTFDVGEAGHSPPIAIEMVGHHMRAVIRYNPIFISDTFTFAKVFEDSSDIDYGRTYDIKLRFRLDPFGDGYLLIWRDGVLLGDYKGALGFNDAIGPNIKQGIYRSAAKTPFSITIDSFELAQIGSGD